MPCEVTSLNQTNGIVIRLFELGKILAEKGVVKFRVQGTCMYPCLREGDVLRVEPKNAKEIDIGDIAVYRRCARLFAHRAVNKGNNAGLEYIITRPDMARHGDDGQIFDKDILGIVAYVERRGKVLDTIKKDYTLLEKALLDFSLKRHYFRRYLLNKLRHLKNII